MYQHLVILDSLAACASFCPNLLHERIRKDMDIEYWVLVATADRRTLFCDSKNNSRQH